MQLTKVKRRYAGYPIDSRERFGGHGLDSISEASRIAALARCSKVAEAFVLIASRRRCDELEYDWMMLKCVVPKV